MDKNTNFVNEEKIKRTIKSLEENNINAYFIKDKEELITKIKELVPKGSTVGCGGSMTLVGLGVKEFLHNGDYTFYDRSVPGLSPDEITEVYRKTFFADAYFTSTNALTEKGDIYNVDGNGNRVAAMIYGPDKVIIICGVNKIVKTLDDAIQRNREIAAPANAKRLDKKTPCATTGHCSDCKSPDKICRAFTVINSQGNPNRMHVLIMNEDLGY